MKSASNTTPMQRPPKMSHKSKFDICPTLLKRFFSKLTVRPKSLLPVKFSSWFLNCLSSTLICKVLDSFRRVTWVPLIIIIPWSTFSCCRLPAFVFCLTKSNNLHYSKTLTCWDRYQWGSLRGWSFLPDSPTEAYRGYCRWLARASWSESGRRRRLRRIHRPDLKPSICHRLHWLDSTRTASRFSLASHQTSTKSCHQYRFCWLSTRTRNGDSFRSQWSSRKRASFAGMLTFWKSMGGGVGESLVLGKTIMLEGFTFVGYMSSSPSTSSLCTISWILY